MRTIAGVCGEELSIGVGNDFPTVWQRDTAIECDLSLGCREGQGCRDGKELKFFHDLEIGKSELFFGWQALIS